MILGENWCKLVVELQIMIVGGKIQLRKAKGVEL